jgi:hypothetical protein
MAFIKPDPMMNSPIEVFSLNPKDCLDSQIKDFMALVLAGGEVRADGLENRIRAGERLVFLTVGCCLCGVAALKCPSAGHRTEVASASGIVLPEPDFPYEIGWVFVMPSVRGRRFSFDLTREALAGVSDGVFATSRSDNTAMHATLGKFEFLPEGAEWKSRRGDYHLKLFVRNALA